MSEWLKASRTLMTKPAFLVVVLVLLAGAIGINAATAALKLHFRKEAMPLRTAQGLAALPKDLATWTCVPEQHSIDPDMVHNLQTDKYLFREYVDTGAYDVGDDGRISVPVKGSPPAPRLPVVSKKIAGLADLNPRERQVQVDRFRSALPTGVLNFALTYYTGKVDTVPHVPDRCYVADGFQPSKYEIQKWKLGKYPNGDDREVSVRFIDFEDQTARGSLNRCVAYFFHANGGYEESPNMVRAKLQDLRQRCAYFAKIEVMMVLPPRMGASENDPLRDSDRKDAARAMQTFLTAALPEIEKMLPDWEARRR